MGGGYGEGGQIGRDHDHLKRVDAVVGSSRGKQALRRAFFLADKPCSFLQRRPKIVFRDPWNQRRICLRVRMTNVLCTTPHPPKTKNFAGVPCCHPRVCVWNPPPLSKIPCFSRLSVVLSSHLNPLSLARHQHRSLHRPWVVHPARRDSHHAGGLELDLHDQTADEHMRRGGVRGGWGCIECAPLHGRSGGRGWD